MNSWRKAEEPRADGALLRCLALGAFLLNGFGNLDLRATLRGTA